MIPSQIQNYVMDESTPAVYAYYFLKTAWVYPIVLVCDDNDVLVGIVCMQDLDRLHYNYGVDLSTKSIGEVCNRKFSFIQLTSDIDNDDFLYREARNIFAEKRISTLPVVDGQNRPIRLFGRFQAFFREMWETLNYSYYAKCVWDASRIALQHGYKAISVIEFGVAGGTGLTRLELYAKEISRLTGIQIEVYGFDTGIGLLPPNGYKDVPQIWSAGEYKMDFDKLHKRLFIAKLVIGDICETSKTFFERYSPAPIAAMLVDVDAYTPTVSILDMLLENDEYFLPIVQMYFDDIHEDLEFQGEGLAIKEFNAKSNNCKISPESFPRHALLDNKNESMLKIKKCIRFTHEKLARPENIRGVHISLAN